MFEHVEMGTILPSPEQTFLLDGQKMPQLAAVSPYHLPDLTFPSVVLPCDAVRHSLSLQPCLLHTANYCRAQLLSSMTTMISIRHLLVERRSPPC